MVGCVIDTHIYFLNLSRVKENKKMTTYFVDYMLYTDHMFPISLLSIKMISIHFYKYLCDGAAWCFRRQYRIIGSLHY